MAPSIEIRRAIPSDLATILHHRREMFRAMGYTDAAKLAAMDASSEPHFARGLADGTYLGWLAETDSGEVVSGGGITLIPYHPNPRDPHLHRAYFVNVYTEEAWRGQGLARRLMAEMIGWCRAERYNTVYLHASQFGRPLYESLGFKPTNEMRLTL